MKIAFLLGGCLLIAFEGRATLAAPSKWWKELSDELEQMKQELKGERERMEADGEKMREEAEADGKKMQEEAKAERKRMYAELDHLKQKCASKGVNVTPHRGKTVGLIIQEVNGFLHFYEQTVNPTTNEIEERRYSLNRNDPNAEPICGQLTR